jgi:hypothetical protein
MAQEFKPDQKKQEPIQGQHQEQMMLLLKQQEQMALLLKQRMKGEGKRGSVFGMTRHPASLKELLDETTLAHGSTVELSSFLTLGIHGILRDLFHSEGVNISEGTPAVITELSLDKARTRLPNLMTLARQNLVATITKNNKVDNAVALVDCRALEILCALARMGLESTRKYDEFAPLDVFTPAEAEELARLDIHKPLPNRQTIAERREARRTFSLDAKKRHAEAEDAFLENEKDNSAEEVEKLGSHTAEN